MRISYWSSDVCSSDLIQDRPAHRSWMRQPVGAADHGHADTLGPGVIFDQDRPPPFDHRALDRHRAGEIGRASCRERVCQYVYISVVAVSLKTNTYTRTPKNELLSQKLYKNNSN